MAITEAERGSLTARCLSTQAKVLLYRLSSHDIQRYSNLSHQGPPPKATPASAARTELHFELEGYTISLEQFHDDVLSESASLDGDVVQQILP